MIFLKDVLSIEEVESHISVKGLTRVKPYPHDILEIEGQRYRLNYMSLKSDNLYEFLAIRENSATTVKLTELIYKNGDL